MTNKTTSPSADYYRTLFDSANEAMLVIDPRNGIVVDANRTFIDWFGYSSHQWRSLPLAEVICEDPPVFTGAGAAELFEQLRSLQQDHLIQCQAQAHSGQRYWIKVQLKPLHLDGQPRILAIIQDISEYKQNEAHLLDSEKHWRTMAENVPDFIIVTDRQGIIQFINKVLPGYDKSSTIGASIFEFQPTQTHDSIRQCLEQVFTSGELSSTETIGAGSPGELRHYISRFSPIKENNQVVAALLIATDITEQKKVQHALHQSEQKFKSAFYASPDVIGITRLADGKLLEVNNSFKLLTGYPKQEAIGHSTLELDLYAYPDERQRLIDHLKQTNSIKDFPITLRTKTGKLRDCLISSEIFSIGEEAHMVSVIRDITESKRADKLMRASEASLRKAHEIANIGDWSWDMQTNQATWSDNLFRIYGYDKASFRGDVWDIVFSTIHPEDRDKLVSTLHNISERHVPKWRMDYRIIRPDGELRYLWGDGEYLFDHTGKLDKVIGIVQDVTERELAKQALEHSQAELEQRNLSLATINAIADRVFRHFNVTAIAKEAIHAISEFANTDSITFFTVDYEQGVLNLAHSTEAEEMITAVRQMPIEGSISGRAVKEQTAFFVADIQQDNRLLEKAKIAALKQGYVSAVSMPAIFQKEVLAVINFAYKEHRTFTASELETLMAFGKSIGLALANARHISQLEIEMRDRRQAEETLRNIAIGVSAATGDEFFRSLVGNVATTFSLDYVFLGELDTASEAKINTIAVWVKNGIAANFEYDLKDTPCENVVNNQPCIIMDSVQQKYPKDLLLKDMEVESYAGTPLYSSQGEVIGIFVALHSRPLANPELLRSMLQIFAVRAAAEIERLAGEAALRNSEEHLRLALNSSNIGTWEWDIASGEVTWSQNVEKIFHLSPGSFKGGYEDYLRLIHPADVETVESSVVDAVKGVRPYAVEHRILSQGDTEYWVYCQGEVHRNAGGEPLRMLGTISDISERKASELKIKASQKMLQLVLDTIPARVFWKDLHSVYLGCNRLFAQDAGLASAQHIIGKTDYDMVWQAQAEQYRTDDQAVMSSGVPKLRYEEPQTQQDKTVWLETSKIPLTDLNGNIMGILGTYADISEHKQALEDKRRSEQRLKLHFQQTPLAVIELNTNMEIVEWNQAAEKIFGYARNEAVGRPVLDLIIQDEQRDQINQVVDSLLNFQGGRRNINKNRTKDGRTILCEWYNTPLVDNNGQVIGVASAAMDITERMNTEQELVKYREHLEELVAQRTDELTRVNKELEAFSYSVSHDLRAPLRSIDGFSQMLLEDYVDKLDNTGKDYLQRVRHGAQRMAQLIDDMLKLSRLTRSPLTYEHVNLSEIATDILAVIQKESPQRSVEIHVAPGLTTTGDAGLLIVVLDNLISNAWKYTSKKSHAVIEIGGSTDNKETTFWIRDNGAGFNMKYADKLFGAFQRLHQAHEFDGSGIGLATVARIIHRHGGSVWAEGEEDHGATFYFTLPNSQTP